MVQGLALERDFLLEGKTAIVTGAAMGLGKAMAEALAQCGANIIVADFNQEACEKTSEELGQYGIKTLFVKMNIRDQEDIEKVINKTLLQFREINILVNNAGIGRPRPSIDVSREEWQEVIDTNLTGLFFMSQAAGRQMIKQKRGNIINIASMSAQIINHEVPQTSYYASKAGVVMITKALAAEWAQFNIRVNAISPGVMMTNQTQYMFNDPAKKQMISKWMDYTPLGRPGQPEELGGAVTFLASENSSYMTGNVLTIDGGYTVY